MQAFANLAGMGVRRKKRRIRKTKYVNKSQKKPAKP